MLQGSLQISGARHMKIFSLRWCAVLVALLVACDSRTPQPVAPAAPVDAAPVVAPAPMPAPAIDEIAAASVQGIEEAGSGSISLVDGRWEGAPYAQGGAARPEVILLRKLGATAKLDAAAGEVRAVLLSASAGGSGESIYLAVFGRAHGAVQNLATLRVGDRVKLRALAAENAGLVLDVVEIGPDQPACCGTQLARIRYRLEGGSLVEAAHEVQGTLSIALLEGAEWTLREQDGLALAQGLKPPTLTLQAGKLAGFGGCNRYMGELKETAPGELGQVPRMLASTMMACEPAQTELERGFLAAMARVTRYTFLEGELRLDWQDGEQRGSLRFAR
jgi:heat shock protein HslJ